MKAVKGWPAGRAEAPVLTLILYNLLVFLTYAWDKLQARRGGRRVPERTLLWLSALGGGPGALLGIYLIRHKTRKPLFALGVPGLLAAQLALAAWVAGQLP
ncbi:MAG: DUF1294 domain-containing protein [Symbiobacteriaceae bacterium]